MIKIKIFIQKLKMNLQSIGCTDALETLNVYNRPKNSNLKHLSIIPIHNMNNKRKASN